MVENGELLIINGIVVSPDGVKNADIHIVGEYIREVSTSIHPREGAKVIDASGKLILPGGIDPHTHLSPPWVDDLTSGSEAAIAGGITTVGTFSYPELKGDVRESLVESLLRMENRVNREAIADVILHSFVWPPSTATREQLQSILALGQR
jgi:dihydropyrimidinase